jgi:hypothetical protein
VAGGQREREDYKQGASVGGGKSGRKREISGINHLINAIFTGIDLPNQGMDVGKRIWEGPSVWFEWGE